MNEYFRLKKTDRNLYVIETVTVDGKKVTAVTTDGEPSYLPIVFDKLRRKVGQFYLDALQESSQ